MKKRKKLCLLAGAVCALCAILAVGGSARAEEESVRSRGSIVLRTGDEVAVYAEDIRYLRGELDALYEEIP